MKRLNYRVMRKLGMVMLQRIILFCSAFVFVATANAANYPLEIIQPQEGLNTNSRYYKAYPGIEYKVPIGVFGGAFPFTYGLSGVDNQNL